MPPQSYLFLPFAWYRVACENQLIASLLDDPGCCWWRGGGGGGADFGPLGLCSTVSDFWE